MDAEERAERLAACIDALREDSQGTPILVEGVRDQAALRRLHVGGVIHVYNRGRPMTDFAEELARDHPRIIVLLDWDRTGGHLVQRLRELLHARVDLDLSYRKELAQVSQVKSLEDVPAALRQWRKRAGVTRARTGDDEE